MVSPECTKKSGRLFCIVANMRMPPRASSMPQPWPQTSPPHTNDTVRRSAGAVRKRPTAGSLRIVGEE